MLLSFAVAVVAVEVAVTVAGACSVHSPIVYPIIVIDLTKGSCWTGFPVKKYYSWVCLCLFVIPVILIV